MNTILFFDALVHGAIRTDTWSCDSPVSTRGHFADRIPGILSIWRARASHRRQLQAMDEHMLKDIGLCRADALREAYKPFWRR